MLYKIIKLTLIDPCWKDQYDDWGTCKNEYSSTSVIIFIF